MKPELTRRVQLSLAASVFLAVFASVPVTRAQDADDDGIDDGVETMLIDRHRPYLFFDSLETLWPTSVEFYIRNCGLLWRGQVVVTRDQLAADPTLLLTATRGGQSSSMMGTPEGSDFRPEPDEIARAGQGGAHVGMYGHVVRLPKSLVYLQREDRPVGQRGDILVQYWQFFGYNDSRVDSCCDWWCPDFTCDPYDHDGDWLYLDVVVSGVPPYTLKNIVYHHHGDANCAVAILPDEAPLPDDGIPKCFLEYNVHEWWYGPNVSDCIIASQRHSGNGVSYRAENIENLGEKFTPMAGLAANLVLQFNGQWGIFGGPGATPADSPMFQREPGFVSPALWVAHVNSAAPNWNRAGFGSLWHPFPTVAQAVAQLATAQPSLYPGDPQQARMLITPGIYPGAVTLDKPLTIEIVGSGTVTIGP